MKNYSYTKKSPFWFFETLDELRISFTNKGFWVVFNVDISEKIKNKVDSSFPKYVSLGFCKPEFAYEYLKQDINLWVFMPCSVAIYEDNWEVFISTLLVENAIWKLVGNEKLEKINYELSETIKEIFEESLGN